MIKIVLALILKLQHVLSESSISFCSSSSTNPNKENYRISNLSLQSQGKAPRVTRIVNDVSNISGNKSNSANSNSSTTPKPTTNSNSTNTLGRTTNLNSKNISSPSSNKKQKHPIDKTRPTAEVLDWLQELFDIMGNNGAFRGDGRCLNTIGGALGQDEASLVGVAARTPKNRH
ncbi:unnamed protein product [Rotaria magnacalcarata]|nr:unnamed protein product [Rotaria magnacalcarata]